jgi:predicted nucleic acid-binding Zn ribbon protein
MSRAAPRTISAAIGELNAKLAPATALARVQEAWAAAAGPSISAAARPVAEHDGVLMLSCDAAVWAQELELMADVLITRINAVLGEETIRELRCRIG